MLLLALLFSTNLENAISTEADHGLIVSSGAEKSAVAAHFAFASSLPHTCIRSPSSPKDLPPNHPCNLQSQTPTKIPASQSEENAHRRWRRQ
jgi:hypothetical protein